MSGTEKKKCALCGKEAKNLVSSTPKYSDKGMCQCSSCKTKTLVCSETYAQFCIFQYLLLLVAGKEPWWSYLPECQQKEGHALAKLHMEHERFTLGEYYDEAHQLSVIDEASLACGKYVQDYFDAYNAFHIASETSPHTPQKED